MISSNGRRRPSESVAEIPSSAMVVAASLLGFTSFVIAPRKAVPAISAWMPALPMSAIAAPDCSKLIPADRATGPANLNAWPSWSTSVFALLDAFASTSFTRAS